MRNDDSFILEGNWAVLEYKLTRIGDRTKVNFQIINVPPSKQKAMFEDWSKVWKQWHVIALRYSHELKLLRYKYHTILF
jgi:hypothetical protein